MSSLPYTYIIGWSDLNLFYYGVRYARGCHPDDFWKTYFTSSKLVHETVESIGDPDIIEIRRTFECSEKARIWEHRVLLRLDVIHDDKWLNKGTWKATDWTGRKHSKETKKKMSNSQKGTKNHKGKNNPFYGKTLSKESREKLSKSLMGRNAWNKGKKNPLAAENGRKGAIKQAATVKGRKRFYLEDGSWCWQYPDGTFSKQKKGRSFVNKEERPKPHLA